MDIIHAAIDSDTREVLRRTTATKNSTAGSVRGSLGVATPSTPGTVGGRGLQRPSCAGAPRARARLLHARLGTAGARLAERQGLRPADTAGSGSSIQRLMKYLDSCLHRVKRNGSWFSTSFHFLNVPALGACESTRYPAGRPNGVQSVGMSSFRTLAGKRLAAMIQAATSGLALRS